MCDVTLLACAACLGAFSKPEPSTTFHVRSQVGAGGDAILEGVGAAADMAASALIESVAGSVLEATGNEEETYIARLRGLPWSYGAKEVCEFLSGVSVNLQPEAVTMLLLNSRQALAENVVQTLCQQLRVFQIVQEVVSASEGPYQPDPDVADIEGEQDLRQQHQGRQAWDRLSSLS